MDWKILGTTLVTIFLAELGDKTQLATLSFASGGSPKWAVFLGASLALIATTALAVLAGETLGRVVPPALLRRVAGALFVLLGILFLLSRPETG
jgi:Ca2+/H+ antiporter, TMEM165/GDT1 family